MSEIRAFRYIVRGRVQGVGFRVFVQRVARGMGLVGSVRNLADGTVEVVAEGPESALKALESELRSGPSASTVTAVERSALEVSGVDGFRMVY